MQHRKVHNMSKKLLLVALAVTGTALLAVPATAPAQEIHLEGVAGFSGTAEATSLIAEGEPVVTCESAYIGAAVSTGGTTAGVNLDFTGCHVNVFGLTAKCRTSGSALDNTIQTSGVFHLLTVSSGKPGILLTPETTTIICAGISNTVVHGNVLGTIVKPSCGSESTEMTIQFVALGTTQEHSTYTGATYDLTTTTGSSGTAKTAALNFAGTVNSATRGKLNCT